MHQAARGPVLNKIGLQLTQLAIANDSAQSLGELVAINDDLNRQPSM